MNYSRLHLLLTWGVALVWLANGLFCKLLHLVPRHQQIVGRILGEASAAPFTAAIGVAEIGMAIWIISGKYSRLCVLLQLLVIGTMNLLEFFLVPDLLLWGRLNAVFALLLMGLVFYMEFVIRPKTQTAS